MSRWANGGQCITVGVAHHLQLFDRLSLTAKKVIAMHVMRVKNAHDVLPEICTGKTNPTSGTQENKRVEAPCTAVGGFSSGAVGIGSQSRCYSSGSPPYILLVEVKVRELGHMDIEACAIMQEGESENQVLSPCACPPMAS
ncbi:unnamed protein product [Sphagnum tenellum]